MTLVIGRRQCRYPVSRITSADQSTAMRTQKPFAAESDPLVSCMRTTAFAGSVFSRAFCLRASPCIEPAESHRGPVTAGLASARSMRARQTRPSSRSRPLSAGRAPRPWRRRGLPLGSSAYCSDLRPSPRKRIRHSARCSVTGHSRSQAERPVSASLPTFAPSRNTSKL